MPEPKHIKTVQDWLEWDPMDDDNFIIDRSLLLRFIRSGWVDALDAYVLSMYMV